VINICGGTERLHHELQQTGQQDLIELSKINIQIKYSNKDELDLIYKDGGLFIDDDQVSSLINKLGLTLSIAEYITDATEEISVKHEGGMEYNLKSASVSKNNINIEKWIENALFQNIVDNHYPFELVTYQGGITSGTRRIFIWNGFELERVARNRWNRDDFSNSGSNWEKTMEVLKYEIHYYGIKKIELTCSNGKTTSLNELNDEQKIIDWIEEASNNCFSLNSIIQYSKINPVENRNCNCGDVCEDYARWIKKYSKENGVDPILILSVMMQESNCEADICGFDGKCSGLMQVTEPTANEVCNVYNINNALFGKENAEANIKCGVKVLKYKYDVHKDGGTPTQIDKCREENINKYEGYRGWQAAIRGYNGWSCSDDYNTDYVEEVWKRYSELLKI
jgi:hypothetical protein